MNHHDQELQQIAAHASDLLDHDAALCFGVECPCRGSCARYLAIDGVLDNPTFIGTCQVRVCFPLFVDTLTAKEQ